MITPDELKQIGFLHEPITDTWVNNGVWVCLDNGLITEISSGESKWLKILPFDNIGLLKVIIYVLFDRT